MERLLEEIFASTGYLAALGAMPDGIRRREDARRFAAFCAGTGAGGVPALVRAIDAAEAAGGETGQDTTPGSTASNIRSRGVVSVGSGLKQALSYNTNGSKIVIGKNTNIEIVSTDTPTIVRNGQTYTNIDSGNISEQFNASKATITDWAFPSNRFTNLSLGATLTSYKAPDCGWFTIKFSFSGSQANEARYCSMFNPTTGLVSFSINGSSQTGGGFGTCIPVKKGDNIQVNYGGTGVVNDYFRFIYAEGIESA